jgi:hypothetical protein
MEEHVESMMSTVFGIVSYLPAIVVWGIGVVFCFTHWQSHPRKARFALAAIALAFLSALFGIAGTFFWSAFVSHEQIAMYFGIQRVIQSVLHAAVWILILMAIFKSEPQA